MDYQDYTNMMVWEWDVHTSGHTLVSQIKNFEEFILLFNILDSLGCFWLEWRKTGGVNPR